MYPETVAASSFVPSADDATDAQRHAPIHELVFVQVAPESPDV